MEAASCPWTKAEDKLAEALPNLAAFQLFTRTDQADDPAEAAAEFVFVDQLVAPESGNVYTKEQMAEKTPHYALVYSSTTDGYQLVATNALGDGLDASGTLILWIERLVTEEDEQAEDVPELALGAMDRAFKNRIGELLEQLYVYWAANGGPRMQSAGVLDGPFHTHPDERGSVGHWQGAEVQIKWGITRR